MDTVGSGCMSCSIPGMEDAGCIFLFGYNPADSHPIVARRIVRAKEKGCKIIVADPRHIETARIAESAPVLEEFGSTPALVDIAADVLAERGFVDASANAVASNEGTKQFLVGTIATGNRFVTGATMRNDAIEATHADCVGMEGAASAHVATKNGGDCRVLRAISDNCDEAYDAICEREFDLFEYARVASDITLDIVRRIAAAQ